MASHNFAVSGNFLPALFLLNFHLKGRLKSDENSVDLKSNSDSTGQLLRYVLDKIGDNLVCDGSIETKTALSVVVMVKVKTCKTCSNHSNLLSKN